MNAVAAASLLHRNRVNVAVDRDATLAVGNSNAEIDDSSTKRRSHSAVVVVVVEEPVAVEDYYQVMIVIDAIEQYRYQLK